MVVDDDDNAGVCQEQDSREIALRMGTRKREAGRHPVLHGLRVDGKSALLGFVVGVSRVGLLYWMVKRVLRFLLGDICAGLSRLRLVNVNIVAAVFCSASRRIVGCVTYLSP